MAQPQPIIQLPGQDDHPIPSLSFSPFNPPSLPPCAPTSSEALFKTTSPSSYTSSGSPSPHMSPYTPSALETLHVPIDACQVQTSLSVPDPEPPMPVSLEYQPYSRANAPDLWVNGSAPMFNEDFDIAMIPPISIDIPASFDTPTSWPPTPFCNQLPNPTDLREAGIMSSSMESGRGSIMNALSAMEREDELISKYTCCGLNLQDLHALVEHFEECHASTMSDSHLPHSTQTPQLQHHHQQPQPQPQPRRHQYLHQQHQQGSLDSDTMELNMDSYLSPSSASFASPMDVHSGTSAQYHPLSAQVSASTSASPSTSTSGASTLHANTLSCHEEERRLRTFADDSDNCRRYNASSPEIVCPPTADEFSALSSGSSPTPQTSPEFTRNRNLSQKFYAGNTPTALSSPSTSTSQPDLTIPSTSGNPGWLGGKSPLPHDREGVETWLRAKGLFSSQSSQSSLPGLQQPASAPVELMTDWENMSRTPATTPRRNGDTEERRHRSSPEPERSSTTRRFAVAEHLASSVPASRPIDIEKFRHGPFRATLERLERQERQDRQTMVERQAEIDRLRLRLDELQSQERPTSSTRTPTLPPLRLDTEFLVSKANRMPSPTPSAGIEASSSFRADLEAANRRRSWQGDRGTTEKSAAQGRESQNDPETETPEVPSRGSSMPETPAIDAYKNMNSHRCSGDHGTVGLKSLASGQDKFPKHSKSAATCQWHSFTSSSSPTIRKSAGSQSWHSPCDVVNTQPFSTQGHVSTSQSSPSYILAPPEKLHPTLSCWIKNMKKLSSLIDRLQELASSAPTGHQSQLLRQVKALRATSKKQQEQFIDFLQLSEEYANEYLFDINASLQQQSSFLAKLERRLEAAKKLRGEAAELQMLYESGTVATMKDLRATALPRPLPEDDALFREIDTVLTEIKLCYTELYKFWTEEISRAMEAFENRRVDMTDFERWRTFHANLRQTIESWKGELPNGDAQTILRDNAYLSREADIGAIASSLSSAMSSVTSALERLPSTNSLKYLPSCQPSIQRVYLSLRGNRDLCLSLLRRCADYGEKVIGCRLSSTVLSEPFHVMASHDLRERTMRLLSETIEVSVENAASVQGSRKFKAAYKKARSLEEKTTSGLDTLLRSWTTVTDGHAIPNNDFPDVTPKQLHELWEKARCTVRGALAKLRDEPAPHSFYRSALLVSTRLQSVMGRWVMKLVFFS